MNNTAPLKVHVRRPYVWPVFEGWRGGGGGWGRPWWGRLGGKLKKRKKKEKSSVCDCAGRASQLTRKKKKKRAHAMSRVWACTNLRGKGADGWERNPTEELLGESEVPQIGQRGSVSSSSGLSVCVRCASWDPKQKTAIILKEIFHRESHVCLMLTQHELLFCKPSFF